MSTLPVTVIKNGTPPVTVIKETTIVQVTPLTVAPPFRVTPYFITAEEGQSAFTLPSTPKENGLFLAAINGTMQSGEAGDYTVVGNILTFNGALSAGDKVFGIYEIK